jgi:hypothetical protein
MSDSTIQYALDHRVLLDEKGNLLTDSAGNIIIPVMPLEVITQVEANHGNCSCGCLTLECNGYTESFRFCNDDSAPFRKDRNQFLATTSNIHYWRAVANLRNIVESSKGAETVSIKVYVGVNDFGTEGRQVSGITTTIKWGNKSVTSATFYTCSMCRNPFFCGELILDWQEKTLTIDTSNVVSRKPGDVCDPVEVEIIDVEAPYNWCYREQETMLLTDTVYTESMDPVFNDLVWEDDEQSVTVEPDESVEDARIREAKGVISSSTDPSLGTDIVSRDFIVTPDGLIYWRDKSKYGIYSYEALRLCPANIVGALRVPVDGNNNDVFVFVENLRSDGAETTGRVFRNVLMEEPPDDVSIETVMQYSVDNCLVAENIPYEEDIEVLVSKIGVLYINMPYQGNRQQTVALLSAGSPECPGVPLQEYEYNVLYATGETVTLTGKTNMGDTFTYTYHEAYTFDKKFTLWVSAESAGYTFPALPGKPYLERVVEDQGTEYEHSYDVVKPDATFPDPDYWAGSRWYFVCEAGRPNNLKWSFVFENTGYEVRDDGWWDTHWCYVFDVKPCYAWSLSPCFQDRLDVPQTIYTNDIKQPVVGDAYGSWDAETKTFTPNGTIAATGFGVYSIPVALFGNEDEGLLTYYSGATARDREIIIEEFE